MPLSRFLTPRRIFLFMLLGLFAFVAYLYFFIGLDAFVEVAQTLDPVRFAGFFSAAVGAMLLVMLFWVVSWRILLKELDVNMGLKAAFRNYWTGEFVDMVLPSPAVFGEVTRLYLVRKETKNSFGFIAAAGLTNRLLSYGVIAGGLGLSMVYLVFAPRVPVSAYAFMVLALVASLAWLGGILYLALSENGAKRVASGFLRLLGALHIRRYENSGSQIMKALSLFNEGFKFYRLNPSTLLKAFALQLAAFALNFLAYVLVFYALGFSELPFAFFIVVFFLAGALQDSLASFSVGSLEIILTSIFIFYGFTPALSGVAAVTLRVVIFWLMFIVGYVMLQMTGVQHLLNGKDREELESEEETEI